MTLHVVDAPMDYAALIAPMGKKVAFATRLTREVELLHAFVTTRDRLEEVLDRARGGLGAEAIVWVSWPKKAARVNSEVTEDTVRAAMRACLLAAHCLRKINEHKKAEELECEAGTLEAALEVLADG